MCTLLQKDWLTYGVEKEDDIRYQISDMQAAIRRNKRNEGKVDAVPYRLSLRALIMIGYSPISITPRTKIGGHVNTYDQLLFFFSFPFLSLRFFFRAGQHTTASNLY